MRFRSQKADAEFAVVGLGRFGTSLALALMENGHSVLGIDVDPVIVQQISSDITAAVSCDATDEKALREVNITAFDTVVVAIGVDFESNLLVTAALKNLGVHHVICKAVTSRQRDILLQVGADRVVLPEHDAGRRLAEELIAPAVIERVHLGPDFSVAEVRLPMSLAAKSLAQLNLRQRLGITVLVIKRGEHLIVSPSADTMLLEEDLLVILGANEALATFSNLS